MKDPKFEPIGRTDVRCPLRRQGWAKYGLAFFFFRAVLNENKFIHSVPKRTTAFTFQQDRNQNHRAGINKTDTK